MLRLCRTLLCAGLLMTASTASAVTFRVGTDAACTHSSLLAAVSAAASNGAGMDEIHLANNQTYSAIIAPIASHSVTVRGGYSSCSDTSPSGRTIVAGSTAGANGTFSTSGTAANHRLILENLELRDGGNATRRGGAVRIEGRYEVILRNTHVIDNQAARGGGIYIDGSHEAEVVVDAASEITNNIATVSGGGLYCLNNGMVTLEGLVLANTAQDAGSDPNESGNGGGVALYGCLANQEDSPGFRGVLANTALRYGGGFYLRDGARLFVVGSGEDPAKLTDNIAGDTGGAIAANDAGGVARSSFAVFDSWIERNLAPTGAGVGIVVGSEGRIARHLRGDACHDLSRCSSLSLNDRPASASVCIGAAAYVGPGGTLSVRGTRVEENCATDAGWAFRQRGSAELLIDSSVIAANGGSQPFFIEGPFTGLLEIAWSTVTRNTDGLQIALFGVPSGNGNTGTLRVYGTILGEPFQQMASAAGGGSLPPMVFQYDCLVVDTFFTQPLGPIRSIELAPPYGMVAPASGNFRLASGSALPVDWCDQSFDPRIGGDADGYASIDDAPRANEFGAHDLGAYELAVPRPDALFANGFE